MITIAGSSGAAIKDRAAARRKTPGGQPRDSEVAITVALTLGAFSHLPLRRRASGSE